MPRLFCFGLGYSAQALTRRLLACGWAVAGTCRGAGKRRELETAGYAVFHFDRGRPLVDPKAGLAETTHILSSVPPDAEGDAVLDRHADDLAGTRGLAWIGYLSTTGVYGDAGGAAVDETWPPRPTSERARARVEAEARWLGLWKDRGLPVHVFRLAGIYGPGRGVLDQVRAGTAKRIEKQGHLFSRIHVDDIANVLLASIAKPRPGAIYNVCDDAPATQAEVVAYACRLLGRPTPPLVPFEQAKKEMSEMALSFWRDSRRVCNRRLKRELGVTLEYPDFRAGLRAVLKAEGSSAP